ncbi:MAG: hypothetical protein L0215_19100 [Gemmataceae bacterium]|nr:hypothetical protein [Gemmataceae bacterium]
MNPNAMTPFGAALWACFEGDTDAELVLRRDDGLEVALPVSHFFREPAAFTAIEIAALQHCRGPVLDAGAGTGLHSLALQQLGVPVTAMDVCPQAVDIMARRGVARVHCADLFGFCGGPFATLLMLGHGVGAVQTIAGLDQFLSLAHGLLSQGGQVLLDSMDVRVTDNPRHLAYLDANRQAGRYIGEVRLQFEFRGQKGPYCGWLHVDAITLAEHADRAGWNCEVIAQAAGGNYLACLTAGSKKLILTL